MIVALVESELSSSLTLLAILGIKHLASQGKVIGNEVEIRQKAIPLGTLPQTYGDRVLIIGDAAGQVKPSTGGGIYFGRLGAQMAAKVLSQALRSDDLRALRLSPYQKEWRTKIGREMSIGCRARQLYGKLGDQWIEQIFGIIDSNGIAESLLESPDFSFDWHSKLILAALGRSLFDKLLHLPREEAYRAKS